MLSLHPPTRWRAAIGCAAAVGGLALAVAVEGPSDAAAANGVRAKGAAMRVAVRAPRTPVAVRQLVRVSGRVSGGGRRARVLLQRQLRRRWRTVTTAAAARDGRYELRFRPTGAGTLTLRVVARSGLASVASRAVRLAVVPPSRSGRGRVSPAPLPRPPSPPLPLPPLPPGFPIPPQPPLPPQPPPGGPTNPQLPIPDPPGESEEPDDPSPDALPVVELCGTLDGARTLTPAEARVFLLTCPLVVGPGATLTMEPGAIVKIEADASIRVDDGGVLEVAGTAESPVVITDSHDDTVGGDTDGDPPGQPYYSPNALVQVMPGATVAIRHATLREGYHALYSRIGAAGPHTARVSVLDSTIEERVELDGGVATVVMERNTLVDEVRVSYADLSGIAMSGPDTNRFADEARKRLVWVGGTVPAGSTWRVDPTPGAVLGAGNVNVEGTLELGAGLVVKASNSFRVRDGGTLKVRGTSADPVILTVMGDNTVGGDTGSWSASPFTLVAPYEGGTVDIAHAVLRNAEYAVFAGIEQGRRTGHLTITDSEIEAPIGLRSAVDAPRLERNVIAASVWLSEGVSPHQIALAGPDANEFVGSDRARIVALSQTAIKPGTTWRVGGESRAAVVVQDWLNVEGTLELGPGAVVKAAVDRWTAPIAVSAGGKLLGQGTASQPVTLTDVGDDLTDDGTDGPVTQPELMASVDDDATLELSHARLRRGTIVQEGGEVHLEDVTATDRALEQRKGVASLRGAISVPERGVTSCDWESLTRDCGIDAAYVDWGTERNPVMHRLLCGRVHTSPHLHGGSVVDDDFGWSPSCSGDQTASPASRLAESQATFAAAWAEAAEACAVIGDDVCAVLEHAVQCLNAAHELAREHAPLNWLLPDKLEDPLAFGAGLSNAAASYLAGVAAPHVDGASRLLFVRDLVGVGSTLLSIDAAYRSCAP